MWVCIFYSFFSKTSFSYSLLSFCPFCVCHESSILNEDIKMWYHHLKKFSYYVILSSLYKNLRGSHWRCKKLLLKFLQYSQEKKLCRNLLIVKLKTLKTLLKRDFLVNIAKFFRKPLLKNICERLLLKLTL